MTRTPATRLQRHPTTIITSTMNTTPSLSSSLTPPTLIIIALVAALLSHFPHIVEARPIVRNVRTHREFQALLKHHKEVTGLPVMIDYYSDGCGPCRMIAPVYKQIAKQYKDKMVFAKVDVNYNRETSGREQIRSMPTFQVYLNGRKRDQFSGADEGRVRMWADKLSREAQKYNINITPEALKEFYAKHAPEKAEDEAKLISILEKAGKSGAHTGVGHYKMHKALKEKYGEGPKTEIRYKGSGGASGEKPTTSNRGGGTSQSRRGGGDPAKPNLHLATLEQLRAEVNKREEEEAAKRAEQEDDLEDEGPTWPAFVKGDFPERVAIIGAGPAGLAAAIYASRAGLRPVVIAPPMGGQLQGKGVLVENYPAVNGSTGPAIVHDMMKQAAEFGAVFEQDLVIDVDTSKRPFVIKTNKTEIKSHTIIMATGADSRWLGVEGENKFRGGGVSSCATCDGFLFTDQEVVVVGGGDTAMEDALVLARTSSKVTVIHRRDSFRASKILAQRVLEHDKITVRWNSSLQEFKGKTHQDVDEEGKAQGDPRDILTHVDIVMKGSDTVDSLPVSGAFIAIGHDPNTAIFKGKLDMDNNGYIKVRDGSTRTSVEGIFASGDVADHVYRQAITSAGTGAMAALDAERWLSEQGIGDEAAEFEASLLREMMDEIKAKGGKHSEL
eukprot:UC4_evm2s296